MIKEFYILIFLIFQTTFSFACINTYQFKVFPVGVSEDQIITVDIQIKRTSHFEGKHLLSLDVSKNDKMDVMWILYSYISVYDKNQKLISLTPLDTTYSIEIAYADTLKKAYQRGFTKIEKEFPEMEYFKPEYISFCGYQQKCNIVTIQFDTILNKSSLLHEEKEYQIDLFRDTFYYGFGTSYYIESIKEFCINSIRIYKTKTLTLILTHLTIGDEISMGLITSDPEKAGKMDDDGQIISLAKEYKPNVSFKDIKKSTYEEPLLHHGYGFDVFIMK